MWQVNLMGIAKEVADVLFKVTCRSLKLPSHADESCQQRHQPTSIKKLIVAAKGGLKKIHGKNDSKT